MTTGTMEASDSTQEKLDTILTKLNGMETLMIQLTQAPKPKASFGGGGGAKQDKPPNKANYTDIKTVHVTVQKVFQDSTNWGMKYNALLSDGTKVSTLNGVVGPQLAAVEGQQATLTIGTNKKGYPDLIAVNEVPF